MKQSGRFHATRSVKLNNFSQAKNKAFVFSKAAGEYGAEIMFVNVGDYLKVYASKGKIVVSMMGSGSVDPNFITIDKETARKNTATAALKVAEQAAAEAEENSNTINNETANIKAAEGIEEAAAEAEENSITRVYEIAYTNAAAAASEGTGEAATDLEGAEEAEDEARGCSVGC